MKAGRLFDPLRTAYLFIGEESFLIEEKLAGVRSLLGEDGSMNVASYHGQEVHRVDEVVSLCNTLPFLSERRLVIVRNAHKIPSKDQGRIAEYLKDPCSSTTLILTIEGMKEEKTFTKKLPPGVEVVRFDPLKGRDLLEWITSRAGKFGKTIDRDAAYLLADATGGNIWFIASEIEKLSLYVRERKAIAIKDVEYLVMRSLEPPIFAFLDSLFDKKKDVIHKLMFLEATGVSELEVISRIEKLITQHYQVLVEDRKSGTGINPYVEKRISGRKAFWNRSQLLSLLARIRGVEQGIKSGKSLHPYAAVHEAIMDVVFPA